MFNIKSIDKHDNIIKARVEPWIPRDRSFNIEVDISKQSIINVELNSNDIEIEMYANKAKNKLCSLVEEAQKNNTEIPSYTSVVTH